MTRGWRGRKRGTKVAQRVFRPLGTIFQSILPSSTNVQVTFVINLMSSQNQLVHNATCLQNCFWLFAAGDCHSEIHPFLQSISFCLSSIHFFFLEFIQSFLFPLSIFFSSICFFLSFWLDFYLYFSVSFFLFCLISFSSFLVSSFFYPFLSMSFVLSFFLCFLSFYASFLLFINEFVFYSLSHFFLSLLSYFFHVSYFRWFSCIISVTFSLVLYVFLSFFRVFLVYFLSLFLFF